MKVVTALALTLLLAGSAAPAAEKPTEESIRHLLEVMQANSMAVMQQRMQTLIPKIQEMVKETAAQAQPAAPH
jgi:hypothetical protein